MPRVSGIPSITLKSDPDFVPISAVTSAMPLSPSNANDGSPTYGHIFARALGVWNVQSRGSLVRHAVI